MKFLLENFRFRWYNSIRKGYARNPKIYIGGFLVNEVQKQATAVDMTNVLKELLREHVVGFISAEEENGMRFSLAGGKTFSIKVEEVL